MKVQFRRLYFGPNKARYKPGRVHDLPEEWFGKGRELLPKGAKVLDDPPAPVPIPAPVEVPPAPEVLKGSPKEPPKDPPKKG